MLELLGGEIGAQDSAPTIVGKFLNPLSPGRDVRRDISAVLDNIVPNLGGCILDVNRGASRPSRVKLSGFTG